ncbi:anti-sigma factor family protein [Microvirga puerhi]|uniref:Anti-sigma factor n=1 Tax=Microvirga puerhi TaxID=2876078 RepID=A0ABS7VU17_9HYPH|nr:anti-sigma factor [Microvirga puerhi]MBZ6078387.1 anti-sigma factor [Microvirga puerhi]
MTAERPIGEDDLHAYVDGHLPPERRAAVEAYLSSQKDAAEQVAAYVQHRDALRRRLAAKASEPIPARLRIANVMADSRPHSLRGWKNMAAAAAWLLVGSAIGAAGHAWITSGTTPAQQPQQVAQDAIAAYLTYVTETAHPVEVGANQEAHLVQWLSRRLGKPILAPNLNAQGFHLIGGRLLPAEASPAALFMYEDEQGKRLTLYARSGGGEEPTAFRFEAKGDVAAFSWIDKDLSYVITGRTDRATLLTIAEAIYKQMETRAPISKDKL